MRAVVGDTLLVSGSGGSGRERAVEILEVRGVAGAPPYLVRSSQGRTSLLYPRPGTASVIGTRRATAAVLPNARKPFPTSLILIMGLALFAPILFVPAAHLPLAGTVGLTFAVLAVAPLPLLFFWWSENKARSRPPRSLCLLLVAVVLAGEILAVALLAPGTNKRCVAGDSMRVVPASECHGGAAGGSDSGQASTGAQWYFGGTGVQVGDTARDGSFAPPEDGGGDGGGGGGGGFFSGGGSGTSGGDSGDTGGDVGGDDGGD